jgi:copper chaperone
MNIQLKTEGMHCGSCEILVKDALEELDGINKAEVSHESGIVKVDFDDSKVPKEKIIETIKGEGYKVRRG